MVKEGAPEASGVVVPTALGIDAFTMQLRAILPSRAGPSRLVRAFASPCRIHIVELLREGSALRIVPVRIMIASPFAILAATAL
jgi:hypothetical protein